MGTARLAMVDYFYALTLLPIPECVHLINVLMVKYSLNVTLQMIGKYPRIYIKAESMPLLRSIVLEHMDSKMLYKLGL